MSVKVSYQPVGQTYEGKEGDSVLDIAIFNDVPMQHACGGFCACTTCHVLVKDGMQNLTEMGDDELERLESTGKMQENSRLGCQARINSGTVSVEIVNLDE